jgi:hypothetical protein
MEAGKMRNEGRDDRRAQNTKIVERGREGGENGGEELSTPFPTYD